MSYSCFIGWADIAELIKRLVSPNRIQEQLKPIIHLAECFVDVDCVEGAKVVGDSVASSITQTEFDKLKQGDAESYIAFLASFEVDPSIFSQEKLALFVSFFQNLTFFIQCRLVLDLEARGTSRIKKTGSGQMMFQELCKSLSSNICPRFIPTTTVLDLLQCFARLGKAENIQSLISNMCSFLPAESETLSYERHPHPSKRVLLDKLLSSDAIWELASSSELGKLAVNVLLDSQFSLLVAQLSTPTESVDSSLNYVPPIVSSVSSYLQLVMKMEENPALANPKRVSSISSLLVQMDLKQSSHLLAAISIETGGNGSKSVVRLLCESLVSQMNKKEATEMPDRDVLLKVLKSFFQLGEQVLTRSLVERICATEIAGRWETRYKCDLFSELISSSNLWGQLNKYSKFTVLNTCAAVAEAWIAEFRQLFDNSGTEVHLRSYIARCSRLFILAEKKRFSSQQKSAAHAFRSLSEKLPTCHLLNLVLDLHLSEANDSGRMKNIPICFDWYRDSCRLVFANGDFKSLIANKKHEISKILNWLLWLDDADSWQMFAKKVCSADASAECLLIVSCFLKDNDVQQSLVKFPNALVVFNRIVDHWVKVSNYSKEAPPITWDQPNAALPEYPEVQAFLRARDRERMTYGWGEFNGIAQARAFAYKLEGMGLSKGFSVQVYAVGTGKFARCEIVKRRDHYDQVLKAFQIEKSQTEELVKLRDRLNELAKKREPPVESPSSQVPPAKKFKNEASGN